MSLLTPLFVALAFIWPMVLGTLLRIWAGKLRAWEAWTGREDQRGTAWWVLRSGWSLLASFYFWLLLGLPLRGLWMLAPLPFTAAILLAWTGLRGQLRRVLLHEGRLQGKNRDPEWVVLRLLVLVGMVGGFASGVQAFSLLKGATGIPAMIVPGFAELAGRNLLYGLGAIGILYWIEVFAVLAEGRERLSQVRDQALRGRLAPHFIFNALATLKAQIGKDPAEAEVMTDRLAALFRQVLSVSEAATIPLRQELAFVEAFLGIQKARFGDRLKVRLDIDEHLMDAELPPLSLQVLVENAVKHGIAPLEEGGMLRVSARRLPRGKAWDLELRVSDPGSGLGGEPGTGTALATLRARLADPDDLTLLRLEPGFAASFRWRQPA